MTDDERSLEGPDKRTYLRHPTDVNIEVETEPSEAGLTEFLRNISLGGLCFRSSVFISPKTVIRIRIPVLRPVFETRGRVAWCQERDDSFDVGVEFLDPKSIEKTRIVEQVCHIEHYRREVLEREGRRLSPEEAAAEWIEKYAAEFPRFGE